MYQETSDELDNTIIPLNMSTFCMLSLACMQPSTYKMLYNMMYNMMYKMMYKFYNLHFYGVHVIMMWFVFIQTAFQDIVVGVFVYVIYQQIQL